MREDPRVPVTAKGSPEFEGRFPPLPWRSWIPVGDRPAHVVCADGQGAVIATNMRPEVAELIVRLVNAEPEIVAALEAANRMATALRDLLSCVESGSGQGAVREARSALACAYGDSDADVIRDALAKVRP